MAQKKDKMGKKQLTDNIVGAAPEIWLAGLAAFAQMQQEGGKFFIGLVNRGKKVEDRVKALAEGRLEQVISTSTGAWDSLEKVMEKQVAQVLKQVGMPSNSEFQTLAERVDALEARAEGLGKKPRAARRPRAAKATTAAKPAAVKTAEKDDLKKIPGLGRIVEKRLHDYGIRTYRQFSQLTEQDMETLEAAGIKIVNRARNGNWVEHAKEQHFQKYNEKL